MNAPANLSASPAGFHTTRWSMVTRAAISADDDRALDELCRAYWFPVYAYARKQGSDPSSAEDITQEFFAEITRSHFLERADPARGRFRTYLLSAVRRRLINAHHRAAALKRGGGVEIVPIDDPTAEQRFGEVNDPGLDPAQAYELSWALTMLQRARTRLMDEQRAKNRLAEFEQLEPFLSAPPSPGQYAELARQLRIARSHVPMVIHRLGRRYRALLREEVAQTVAEAGEINDELSHLLKVLSR